MNRETLEESGEPIIPARVFMYMIGQEVGDLYPAKHMACSNKGIQQRLLWLFPPEFET